MKISRAVKVTALCVCAVLLIACESNEGRKWPVVLTDSLLKSTTYERGEPAYADFRVFYIGDSIDTIRLKSLYVVDTLRELVVSVDSAQNVKENLRTVSIYIDSESNSQIAGHATEIGRYFSVGNIADSLTIFVDTAQIFCRQVFVSPQPGNLDYPGERDCVSSCYPVFLKNVCGDTLCTLSTLPLTLEVENKDGSWSTLYSLLNSTACFGEPYYFIAPGEMLLCPMPLTSGKYLRKARLIFQGNSTQKSNTFYIRTNFP